MLSHSAMPISRPMIGRKRFSIWLRVFIVASTCITLTNDILDKSSTHKWDERNVIIRFWDKIATIERAILTLLRLTQSGRLSHILSLPFRAKWVHMKMQPITYDVFDGRILAVAQRHGLTGHRYEDIWRQAQARSAAGPGEAGLRVTQSRENLHLTPHCEVGLIQFFTKNKITDQVYNYIGVSRLSCYPCLLFINGYNRIAPHIFRVRGTHGKVYGDWCYPNLPDRALHEIVMEHVREHLPSHVETSFGCAASSVPQDTVGDDSTDASDSSLTYSFVDELGQHSPV